MRTDLTVAEPLPYGLSTVDLTVAEPLTLCSLNRPTLRSLNRDVTVQPPLKDRLSAMMIFKGGFAQLRFYSDDEQASGRLRRRTSGAVVQLAEAEVKDKDSIGVRP